MLKDIISGKVISTDPQAKVSHVAQLMSDHDVGCVLVVENGKPKGLVTDRDIVLRCVAKNMDPQHSFVAQIMTRSLATVRDTAGIFDCIERMKEEKVRRIPVVNEKGEAVGILSFGDLMSLLGKEMSEVTEGTTPEFHLKKPSASFKQVA